VSQLPKAPLILLAVPCVITPRDVLEPAAGLGRVAMFLAATWRVVTYLWATRKLECTLARSAIPHNQIATVAAAEQFVLRALRDPSDVELIYLRA
jgi:hypothetical protein